MPLSFESSSWTPWGKNGGHREGTDEAGARRRRLAAPPPATRGVTLCLTDVRRLQSLRTADDVELQPLAFGKRLEALARDRRVVNEDVLSAFLLDETKTLGLVEPLHGTCSHSVLLVHRGQRPNIPSLSRGPTRPIWPGPRTASVRIQKKPQAVSPAARFACFAFAACDRQVATTRTKYRPSGPGSKGFLFGRHAVQRNFHDRRRSEAIT